MLAIWALLGLREASFHIICWETHIVVNGKLVTERLLEPFESVYKANK